MNHKRIAYGLMGLVLLVSTSCDNGAGSAFGASLQVTSPASATSAVPAAFAAKSASVTTIDGIVMVNRFSFNPNPAQPNQAVTICYNFTTEPPVQDASVHVTVKFLGTGVPDQQVVFKPGEDCVDVQVPGGCEAVKTVDHTGNSAEGYCHVGAP